MIFKIPKTEFLGSLNLKATLESDQCPSDIWSLENGRYRTFIKVDNNWISCSIWEDENNLFVESKVDIVPQLLYHFWSDYPLLDFYKKFGNDKYISRILSFCRGLRIMRDFDIIYRIIEAVLTQNTSVKQIRVMESRLRRFYGDGYGFDLRKIANASEKELQQTCKVGYRARYLIDLAKALLSGNLDIEEIKAMKSEDARKTLMEFNGIGPKVADIILLYGFGKPDVFPMDTWLRKALVREYFKGKPTTDRKLRKFALSYFGKHAGVAHLYMFYYERKIWHRK